MSATSVKYFDWTMTGAPVLNNGASSGLGVLDACLADGFGLQSATSVVVSGGVATATFATTPSNRRGTVALVAGATPAVLNGEQRVTASGANTISWATTAPDGVATGTITVKVAPLGWAKAFTGTNLRCYKITDPAGTGCYLRVSDPAGDTMRLTAYTAMTAVSTGTGPFPTAAQVPGGVGWGKTHVAAVGSDPRPWYVVGDERSFYFCNVPNFSGAMFFGDILPNKSGDAYACFLTGATSGDNPQYTALNMDGTVLLGDGQHGWLARSDTGLGTSRPGGKLHGASLTSAVWAGSAQWAAVYPNRADNSLRTSPMVVYSDACYRGRLPGLHLPAMDCAGYFTRGDVIPGTDDLAGRELWAFRHDGANNHNFQATAFFDITGPWR